MHKPIGDLIKQFDKKPKTTGPWDGQPDKIWWNLVGSIVTDPGTGARVRQAFKPPVRVVTLPVGTVLYKFNGFNSLQSPWDAKAGKPISPWWSAYHPYEHDPGWMAKMHIARTLKVSVREWGRLTSAVREDWNALMWLLVITLKVEVRAAFGGFSHMPRMGEGGTSKRVTSMTDRDLTTHGITRDQFKSEAIGNSKGRLPGGGTQFYIPDLFASQVEHRFESLANR